MKRMSQWISKNLALRRADQFKWRWMVVVSEGSAKMWLNCVNTASHHAQSKINEASNIDMTVRNMNDHIDILSVVQMEGCLASFLWSTFVCASLSCFDLARACILEGYKMKWIQTPSYLMQTWLIMMKSQLIPIPSIFLKGKVMGCI